MNDLRLKPLVDNRQFIVITPHNKFLGPLFPLALELYDIFSIFPPWWDGSWNEPREYPPLIPSSEP